MARRPYLPQRRGGVGGPEHLLRCADAPQLRQIRLHAVQVRVVERLGERRERGAAGLAAHDDLGEHRVVERTHLGAGVHPRLDAGVGRELDGGEQSGAGPVVVPRVLRVHARLHGVTEDAGPAVGQGVEHLGLAPAEPQHPLHQVHARDLLGDRMLHLQTGVHLEERGLTAFDVVHELHGAGGAVAHRRREPARRREQFLDDRVGQVRGGRLLDDLLVASLQRAVARTEADRAAATVAEHLHLEVAGVGDEPFEEHPRRGEVCGRETLHPLVRVPQFARSVAGLHPDAAPAADGLEHHGVTDGVGGREGGVDGPEQAAALDERDADGACRLSRGVLVAEDPQLPGGGPDERDARLLAGVREFGVLREESVAGMDRAGARRQGRLDHQIRPEIRLRCRGRAETHGHVRHLDVRGGRVRIRVHGDGLQPQRVRRTHDAASDLAAVGDEQGVESERHDRLLR